MSAYFNIPIVIINKFEMSSSTCTTASKQTMQNVVMVAVEFSLDNTE